MANIQQNNSGSYIPITQVWDVGTLPQDLDPIMRELFVRLYQNLNKMAYSLNLADKGFYNTLEFVNGQLFFPNPNLNSLTSTMPTFRNVYRKVINWNKPLPNAGSDTMPHGIPITPKTTFTRIYGVANNPSNSFIPLPFVSFNGTANIEVSADATNVTIKTNSNRSAYTQTYIVLEYIQT